MLTKFERNVIVGSLLGDGSITQPNSVPTARIQICQSIKQKEWVLTKYNWLKELVSTPPKDRMKIEYPVTYFNTQTLPELYNIYNAFINEGRKGAPQNIGELISPIGLAVWYGDDGYTAIPSAPRLKNPKPHGYLCTDSFYETEIDLLRIVLKEKYHISTTKWSPPSAKGRIRIYIRTKSFPTLSDIIEPYLPPSLKYKLGC